MITADEILQLVPNHLAAQRWYDHDGPPPQVDAADSERWLDGDHELWWLLVDARDGSRHLGRYQLVLGARPANEEHPFLHWVRRMLEIRREFPVFGTGRFEVLHAENPSVLAYLRSSKTSPPDGDDDTKVLCVHNLSRFPQPCELMLGQHAGRIPIELTGRIPFPEIGELPYFITLPPYGFYWFTLVDPETDGMGEEPYGRVEP